jgi:hypothetical protein
MSTIGERAAQVLHDEFADDDVRMALVIKCEGGFETLDFTPTKTSGPRADMELVVLLSRAAEVVYAGLNRRWRKRTVKALQKVSR